MALGFKCYNMWRESVTDLRRYFRVIFSTGIFTDVRCDFFGPTRPIIGVPR